MVIKLYVEGGGNAASLKAECRKGFNTFLGKAGLVADPDTLQAYFGQGFQRTALPNSANHLESLGTATLYRALGTASKNCKTKRAYNKGTHSFALLALIDPNKVINASPWAKRFIEEIRKQMGKQ